MSRTRRILAAFGLVAVLGGTVAVETACTPAAPCVDHHRSDHCAGTWN